MGKVTSNKIITDLAVLNVGKYRSTIVLISIICIVCNYFGVLAITDIRKLSESLEGIRHCRNEKVCFCRRTTVTHSCKTCHLFH